MKIDEIPRLSGKEAVILELLIVKGEQYGLGIVTASEGRVKAGTLYVTLNRMTEKGYVSSRQDEQSPAAFGPPRRLYRVTGLGEQVYQAWNELSERAAGWQLPSPGLIR